MIKMFDIEAKEAFITFGIVAIIVWLTTPKMPISRVAKPDRASDSEITQKDNAMIALDAYMSAVENRENSRTLNSLNNELASTYGLRVYKKDNYFVARNLEGKDILVAK